MKQNNLFGLLAVGLLWVMLAGCISLGDEKSMFKIEGQEYITGVIPSSSFCDNGPRASALIINTDDSAHAIKASFKVYDANGRLIEEKSSQILECDPGAFCGQYYYDTVKGLPAICFDTEYKETNYLKVEIIEVLS